MAQGPLSPSELKVLDVLLGGARTLKEISAAAGDGASTTLRSLELREPPYVEVRVDEGLGERVWAATAAGGDARDAAR